MQNKSATYRRFDCNLTYLFQQTHTDSVLLETWHADDTI